MPALRRGPGGRAAPACAPPPRRSRCSYGLADPPGAFLALIRGWIGQQPGPHRSTARGSRPTVTAPGAAAGPDPRRRHGRAGAGNRHRRDRGRLRGGGTGWRAAAGGGPGGVRARCRPRHPRRRAPHRHPFDRAGGAAAVVALPLAAGDRRHRGAGRAERRRGGRLPCRRSTAPCTAWRSASASTMLGVSVDYPVLMIGHRKRGEPAAGTRARIGPTFMLAVLTAALGPVGHGVLGVPGPGAARRVRRGRAGDRGGGDLVAAAAADRCRRPCARRRRRRRLAGAGRAAAAVAPARAAARGAPPAWLAGRARRPGLGGRPGQPSSPVPAASRALDAELRAALGAPDVGPAR